MGMLQDRAQRLINDQGNSGCRHTLDDVDRRHRKAYEAGDIVDIAVDLCSGCNDSLKGHTEQFGKGRQQIHAVEGRPKHRHHQRPRQAGEHGILSGLLKHIDDGSRQDKAAADHEISQITHESRARSLHHQFQQDLTEFDHHPRHRPESKGSHQCRNLTEIQLVESGRQKKHREIKDM